MCGDTVLSLYIGCPLTSRDSVQFFHIILAGSNDIKYGCNCFNLFLYSYENELLRRAKGSLRESSVCHIVIWMTLSPSVITYLKIPFLIFISKELAISESTESTSSVDSYLDLLFTIGMRTKT